MDDMAREPAQAAPDPAVARAERRLRLLEELTEIGMGLARRLTDEATDSAGGDPAEAYVRVSRAVRLTIALEAKTDQQLADLVAGIVREREEKRVKAAERAREAADKASQAREHAAYCRVLDIAESESADQEDFEGLVTALDERLAEDPAYEDCGEWPLRELVERLCRDLDLHPDWSHWTGEGWDSAYDRNPFRRPSRRPLVWAYDEPAKAESESPQLE